VAGYTKCPRELLSKKKIIPIFYVNVSLT